MHEAMKEIPDSERTDPLKSKEISSRHSNDMSTLKTLPAGLSAGHHASTVHHASNESADSHPSGYQVSKESPSSPVSQESSDDAIADIKIKMAQRIVRHKAHDESTRATCSANLKATSLSGINGDQSVSTLRSQSARPSELRASDFAADEDDITLDMPTKSGQIQPTPHRALRRTTSH
eukprot:TRINITY_DN31265_c0_g1_i1.p1 TRINITY_DN31265_c0_g1~~TRINITY_DN31265_c0_g1_i1.p1  ORF type:complete len:178 (-),score=15.38 TRINITY_DN31265_c0_g1_i1:174-707(-)